jgi:glutamine amidotransferase
MLFGKAVRIAVCDTGLGNLRSVERALVAAGGERSRVSVEITRDPARVRAADKVVMPGQGGFGDCARALDGGLGDALREAIRRGAPYLGICLGLQVLFAKSEEADGARGLGIFEGDVVKLRGGPDATSGGMLKIPHTGWNEAVRGDAPSFLPTEPTHFYFVHSYVVAPRDARIVAATTEHGERFVSAIAKDNIFACQFHPEKSQRAGLALLARFIEA